MIPFMFIILFTLALYTLFRFSHETDTRKSSTKLYEISGISSVSCAAAAYTNHLLGHDIWDVLVIGFLTAAIVTISIASAMSYHDYLQRTSTAQRARNNRYGYPK